MKLYDIAYEPMEIITEAVWPIPALIAVVVIAAAVLILALRKRRKKQEKR
jgi:cytochrome c-type biogenesis protein CcmH/NrfF